MNCLLYENRTGPDQDLMQATSARGAVASYTSDDEEDRRLGGEAGSSGVQAPVQSSSRSTGLARLRASKNS